LEMGKAAFDPTIKALIALIGSDCQVLNAAHASSPLIMNIPATSAAMDRMTDRAT
jgi:hypothetical protein